MSATTIPAEAVRLLRAGLYDALGEFREAIDSVIVSPDCERHGDLLAEPVAKFDRARAVLDVIGWSEHEHEPDAVIDLDPHRPAIQAALSEQLRFERDRIAEATDDSVRMRADLAQIAIERFALSASLDLTSQEGGEEKKDRERRVALKRQEMEDSAAARLPGQSVIPTERKA